MLDLRRVSQAVFNCFHRFERLADRATRRVGPFFVLLCTALLVLGIVTFCSSFHSVTRSCAILNACALL